MKYTLIVLFLLISLSLDLKAQRTTFELIEIDTNFIDLDLSFHKEDYNIKLDRHKDGNYVVYYYHTFPEFKCMTYTILDHQLQGFLRKYNKKGELTSVAYYSLGKLLMHRKIKDGKVVEEKWF